MADWYLYQTAIRFVTFLYKPNGKNFWLIYAFMCHVGQGMHNEGKRGRGRPKNHVGWNSKKGLDIAIYMHI